MCIYTYIHTRDAAAHALSTGWTLLCELTQPHSGESNVVKTREKPKSMCPTTASVMSTLTTSKHPTCQLHKFQSLQSCPCALCQVSLLSS